MRWPIPLLRVSIEAPVLKLPKLYVLILLAQQGWGAAEDPGESWSPLRPREYVAAIHKRPASYFAAVAFADSIVSKNVEVIHHWKTDMYYRCLVLPDADKLMAMFEAMDGNADTWLRDQVKDLVDFADAVAVAGGEHEDVAPLLALSAPVGLSVLGDVV